MRRRAQASGDGRPDRKARGADRPGAGPFRRLAGLILAGAMLAGCAGSADQMAQEEPRGGIGGTGVTTGVLGTVTGLGSVQVNGVTVEIHDELAESPFGPVSLAEGQVIEVLAEPSAGQERAPLIARRIVVTWPLVGPITDVGDQNLTVMGVPVVLEDGAPIPGPEALAPGRRVAVSGLWRGDAIVASRLDPAPAGAADLVTGIVRRDDAVIRVGGLALSRAADLASGAVYRIRGQWTGETLAVEAAEPGRPLLRAGPLSNLSVEGYLTAGPQGRLAIDGLGVAFDEGARVDPLQRDRAVYIGRLDGRFHVEHGIPLPDGAAARAEALEAIGNGLAPERGAIVTR